MKPLTVIFFGKSGSGKGTQSDLLLKKLTAIDPDRKVLYVETGQRFREFMNGPSYVAKKVKETLSQGKLMPPFLAVWNWTGFLIENLQNDEHLVFDGICRRIEEAPMFEGALQFLDSQKPVFILLDVNHEEVTRRLLARGRHDDKHEKIAERLGWFEKDVVPAINFFKESPHSTFVTVNGDQSIEKVHADVLRALGIKA